MLRWMDGFEHYGVDETKMLEGVGGASAWSEVNAAWDLSTANPATGTTHMRLTETASFGSLPLRRALGQSKQVSGFGYRFQVDELPAREEDDGDQFLQMLDFRDVANGEQIRIQLGTEGSVHALRGSTSLGRSDPCIAAGGYHHFEAKAKIANAGGYVEARVNEVTVLNLPGIDTQSTANAETSQFRIKQAGTGVSTDLNYNTFDVDDVFAWDDDASDPENTVVDFVGDKGCYYLPVIADTPEADWEKSSGVSGYPLLDELAPNDADYIADTTGAARSIFDVAPLPDNVAELIAAMPVIRARKEESGTVEIRGGVVVDADESYGPTDAPSTEFAYLRPGPKTVDPSTGVAWANTAEPKLLIERTA